MECPTGTQVTLCLRPEFINPRAGAFEGSAPDPAMPRNIIQGKVEALVFIGDAYEGEIRVEDKLLLARIDPETELSVGERVFFEMSPNHCLLVSK
jgi:iron(III) transport system ATP-binding protein